ncbi:SUKH-4 family immunity protein [Streptomyces apocyni]|uniref:SUKH-4 family immunity protein n=1 Tax=Streptomyces apocyni TaxID=2654677 RepID=UPI0012EA3D63|nr:SUKH-4 family immunity protein [Streptomyces apocyni]
MVTFAQAQERAEQWINGGMPSYQHREVRVREFELGFVVWAEDREDGPRSDGGQQRLVIARDSGEATLWPGLPVGDVIRRYEEEYGVPEDAPEPAAAEPERVDLNQTSFLLSPPEWLQEAADNMGIPDRRASASGSGASGAGAPADAPAPGSTPPAGSAAPWAAAPEATSPEPAASAPSTTAPSTTGSSTGGAAASTSPSSGFSTDASASGGTGTGGPADGSAWPDASSSHGGQHPGAPNDTTASGNSGGPSDGPAWPGAGGSQGGQNPGGTGDAADSDRTGGAPAGAPWPDAGGGSQSSPAASDDAAASGESAAGSAWPSAGGSHGGRQDSGAAPGGGSAWPSAGGAQGAAGSGDVAATAAGVPDGSTPWAGTDTNADGDDRSVPAPATVFAPPLSGNDADDTPPPTVAPDAPTALMSGGSQLPKTTVARALDVPGAENSSSYGYPQPQPQSQPEPQQTAAGPGGAGDISDAATSKAMGPPRGARGGGPSTPPPPSAPGTPGAPSGGTPPPSGPGTPGNPAGGYVPTQLVSQLGPDGPQPPPQPPTPPPGGGDSGGGVHHAATMLADPSQGGGLSVPKPPGAPGTPGAPQPPGPPGTPGTPPGGVHHAATMFADPSQGGGLSMPKPPGAPGTPGAPQPPGPPGAPGAPGAPQPPGAPGAPGGGVHHAATMFADPSLGGGAPAAPQPPGPPGAPGAPGGTPGMAPPPGAPQPPAAYGYPQPPPGQPTVGPGYQAVLRYRAQDGSEQQLIRRSAPGTPHPEWQMLHELRAMNVSPQQVLELHTELESCELPGAYCARMIRETWPQARITSIAPYGRDHASRQQGMRQLLAHQGELHQVADGPARPGPVRAPLQPVQPAPPVPPDAVGHELMGAFGPQGVFRFDQRAVSRAGVPEIVAHTLVWAGLPLDFNPFFWAQAQPGRPVPTLAELAQERQVQPASDAGSYLVMGSDFGRAICVQYGTAHIVAVPVEAGPGGAPVPPQFVNTGLPEFVRCLALLGRMWRLRTGLNQEQAARWTIDFQQQLAALDAAALGSPESWWSVLLEQMWDGLL